MREVERIDRKVIYMFRILKVEIFLVGIRVFEFFGVDVLLRWLFFLEGFNLLSLNSYGNTSLDLGFWEKFVISFFVYIYSFEKYFMLK